MLLLLKANKETQFQMTVWFIYKMLFLDSITCFSEEL